MFEEYKEVISIDQIFKDTYNYDFNGDLKELIHQNFIEVEGNGVDALFWFYYKGEKYLFKPLENAEYNVWGEILSSYLAEYLNIPHAEYRIAQFNDKLGVITKSIVKDKEKIVLGSELFQDFYNCYPYKKEDETLLNNKRFRKLYEIPEEFVGLNAYDRKRLIFNYLNNLDSISSMISTLKNINQEEKVNIIRGVKLTLIYDIISLQYDRHPNNWGAIKREAYEFSPLFDNSTSFGLGYPNISDRISNFTYELLNASKMAFFHEMDEEELIKNTIYDKNPTLVCDTDDSIDPLKKTKKKIPEVLDHFLRISSAEEKEEAISIILSVDSNVIENIIKQAEKDNYIQMDERLKAYILILFDNHLNIIHKIANKYRRRENDISK